MVELPGRALLFDLDGTLVDSTELITRAWTSWAIELGLSRDAFAGIALHGRPARDIVHDLVPEQEEEALRRVFDIEASTLGGVTPLPGANELLRSLDPAEWGIVTSGSLRIAEPRLAALAVSARTVITADDVRFGKPDPEPFLLGAERLGVSPADCVVLEDAPAGLTAARTAGMRSVAVVTTHRREALSATVVVRDLRSVSAEHVSGHLVLRVEEA
ncbi:MAG: HAD-IA family hydrolase [Candidatus Dormibacteraceae bacterium]